MKLVMGREWKRLVSDVLETMEDVPSIVKDRIEVLDKTYREEFSEYYRAEAAKRVIDYSDKVLRTFDIEWDKKHPEYYDMNKLFDGCDALLLEKNKSEIERLQSFFK